MKKSFLFLFILCLTGIKPSVSQETKDHLNVSEDLVSSFIWRGTRLGNGPAIQPTIEFSTGGLTLGSWGSYYFADIESSETDLYASYTFDFGLSLGITDYYFPAFPFFKTENHAFELNGGFETEKFDFSANYILNEGAGATGGDLYYEAGFTSRNIRLFVGAGNGWYTPDKEFTVCNTGLTVTREIRITDAFSIPLTGSLIFNPRTERLFLVAGITL